MSYVSLYRKFRPITFDEMVGQEHITKTLKNQIMSGRVGHAYLFCGGRGTGKTSSAKILARAINCTNKKNGEPCNVCEMCNGELNGSLTDVVEMDAASNNGVENIRQIREEVNFLPTTASYRVYIIDEVHMLSTGAFNALLKTLEEPPEHVIFILATTEPTKLPATILSRCQRFDYKKICDDDIIKRLKVICTEINVNITESALKVIAVLSEGALRDAISILERCIADEETEISEEKVKDLAGIPKLDYISKIAENILNEDSILALESLDEILKEGKDYTVFIWELIKYLKDILVYKSSESVNIYSEKELLKIKILSEKTSSEKLLKLIYLFSELESSIKWSGSQLIMLQAAIIRASSRTENNGLEELTKRVEKLELEEKINVVSSDDSQQEIKADHKDITLGERKVATIERKQDIGEDTTELSYWKDVILSLKQTGKVMLYTNLIGTRAREINDMTIGIEFVSVGSNFSKMVIEKPENIQILKKLIIKFAGKEMNVKCLNNVGTDNNKGKAQESNLQAKKVGKASADTSYIEDIAKDLSLDINIIEE